MPENNTVKQQHYDQQWRDSKCGHGTWNYSIGECACQPGWRFAGITDPINYMKRACTQFGCSSDDHCYNETGVEMSACPMPGWNCYCGWGHALQASLNRASASGLEDKTSKCMGIMYTLCFFMTRKLEWLVVNLPYPFVFLACLGIPFGKKRLVCDHHRKTIWTRLDIYCGPYGTCHGKCISGHMHELAQSHQWAIWVMDNFAWTLYILDIMVWTYALIIVFYLTLLAVWSIALWMLVIIVLIFSCCMALCMFIGGGGGAAGGGDTNGDCDCCCNHGADAGGGMDAFRPDNGGTLDIAAPTQDQMLYAGHFPRDPFWGYWGYGYADTGSGLSGSCHCDNCGCGDCCNSKWLCRPLAHVILLCPVMPENAWGGFIGYLMGTHPSTPTERMYTGGRWYDGIANFLRMGWRRRGDLSGDERWRQAVRNFLRDTDAQTQGHSTATQSGQAMQAQFAQRRRETYYDLDREADIHRVGGVRVADVQRVFTMEKDGCFESNYDIYKKNKCWICQDGRDKWDMWLTCKHLYCEKCSDQMMRRGMPCPLCRMASAIVLRGNKYSATPHGE